MFYVILHVGVCTFEIGCNDVHLFDSEYCGVNVWYVIGSILHDECAYVNSSHMTNILIAKIYVYLVQSLLF